MFRNCLKGQVSYIIKPITLISTIILLFFLFQSISENKKKEQLAEKKLDIISSATNILLILANSGDCLAFESQSNLEKANILDVKKIEHFSSIYQEIEPECARNFGLGWRVKITEYDEKGVKKEWFFGAKEFSQKKSLLNSIDFWMPVAIRYSEKDIRVGRMDITLVEGELEKIAGFIDWSCQMGKLGREKAFSVEISISDSLKYENGYLCLSSSCRKLICTLNYFSGFEKPGKYVLTLNFKEPNVLLVGK